MPISSQNNLSETVSRPTINGNIVNDGVKNWKNTKDVGILSMEIYFPKLCVDQNDLERYDNVSEGKYTIGLGQERMAFGADCEDIYSFCLTAVQRLMEKSGINYSNIGRLEVGTETIMDKSKSIKTILMQLFEESGNFDVEGVDNINACYGGTAALLNSINWIESESWDGRLALVVAGDIAVYAAGPARPTGGAGAIAMLIGPNAPLVIDRGTRSTFAKHVYDFYKPNLMSEYPEVDGKLSIQCYLESLDNCYNSYMSRLLTLNNPLPHKNAQPSLAKQSATSFPGLDHFDYFCFHSPYCKLVEKSFARLNYLDYINESHSSTPNPASNGTVDPSGSVDKYQDVSLLKHKNKKPDQTYFDRDVEKDFMKCSKPDFDSKVLPTLQLAKQIGNMYTPSLYGSLLSLLHGEYVKSNNLISLVGKRVGMFSYGSGSIATLFSIYVKGGDGLSSFIPAVGDISKRLDCKGARKVVDPELFARTLKFREENHLKAPYKPVVNFDDLYPGTYYLTSMDEKYRRSYDRKKLS